MMTRRFGFLLLDDFALLSCAAAVEPLRAANLLSDQTLYDIQFLSVDGGPISASVGCSFDTISLAEAGTKFDFLFVVAGGNPFDYHNPAVPVALRAMVRAGVGLGGISGGGVILAKNGMMTNRRFTVHWHYMDALREISPDFLLERKLFIIDRDRYTCAGGMAPLDMMYALIVGQNGLEIGRKVSDWFIHTRIREAEDPQKSGLSERYSVHHPTLIATIEMMQSHIADPLSLEQLASLSGISLRQVQRLFAEHLGKTGMRFYRELRLDVADALLVQTSMPILEVALATGFNTSTHFARAFREQYGMAPKERRKRHRVQAVPAD